MVVAIIVIIALIVWIIAIYNNLTIGRNKVKNAFAQIDTVLQRRFDLIPNLVETVKGYAAHEQSVFENVTKARAGYMSAKTNAEKLEAENELTSTLKTLFAVAENYPELKSNQNFLKLQEDLKVTEDKVSFSRQFYNDTVTMYNTKLQVFPSNIIAGMFNFSARDLFKSDDEARKNVKVDFGK